MLFMTIIVSESAVNSERIFGFAGALVDILTFRNRATHLARQLAKSAWHDYGFC